MTSKSYITENLFFHNRSNMSEFKVKLNNSKQGMMDVNPATQAQFSTSVQRTIFVQGPGKKYRKLFDGEQFVDCNYWKKFAYPQIEQEQAFIEVVSDDGSIYSENPAENNFPSVYTLTVSPSTAFEDNVVDIAGDTDSFSNFVQISNLGSNQINIRLNGLESAIFTLGQDQTQVFNSGDLLITKLEFTNTISGAVDADVQVLCSVRTSCLS